jgi:two-component sensor histidine kinase
MRDNAATALAPTPTSPRAKLNAAGLCRRQDCSLIAEADHRIANHLALLAGHVRLKAAELAKRPEASGRDAIQLLLLGVQAEISAVARLHRKLSGGNAQTSSDLADEMHEVCAPFNSGLSGDLVVVEDFEPGCHVTADQILPVTQIVTEVITNALKYAAGDGRGGLLVARLRKGEPGSAVIEIIDHGPGFPSAFNPATDGGLGFRVVRALAVQLEATASFSSTAEGLRFTLTLPLARIDEPGC